MADKSRSRGIRRAHAERSSFHKIVLPAEPFLFSRLTDGAALLIATVVALVWANSPWSASYFALWKLPVEFSIGRFALAQTLSHWVNDGLMTVFFFYVALEIKREMDHGELSSVQRAALPLAAALGGMVGPALVYTALNWGSDTMRGWAIPMATDIAFAIGVLALLGPRVSSRLRIFLLAMAIIDDVGSILVIAAAYTDDLAVAPLILAAALVGVIYLLKRVGFQSGEIYVLIGLIVWVAVYKSGVHATLAGVVLGLVAPTRPWFDQRKYEQITRKLLDRLSTALDEGNRDEADTILGVIEAQTKKTEAPAERLERQLHPWITFLVLPVFALANAGVALSWPQLREAAASPMAHGILLGLLAGKVVGITGASWLAAKVGLATRPQGVTWLQIAGVSALGGIGFTVSLFFAELSFSDPQRASIARISILAASLLAGIVGYLALQFVLPRDGREQ